MQPVIGITTYQEKNAGGLPTVMMFQAYLKAVQQAGGIPVLVPSLLEGEELQTLYNRLDGILLAGGGDISLQYFEGDDHPRIDGVDLERDALELDLLQAAVDDGKPFLGICRGIQLVNVGLGGSLYTHLADQFPEAIDHTYPGNMRQVIAHRVHVERDTKFGAIVSEKDLEVNSLHHQGIKDVASGLHVAGHAPDGLVEAVELSGHPFGMAVQWHPEWLTDQLSTRNLFAAFVTAAKSRQE